MEATKKEKNVEQIKKMKRECEKEKATKKEEKER